MFKRLVAAAVALSLQAPLSPTRADLLATTVPGSQIAAQLQQTLGSTAIHLHNLGPVKDGSTYVANASSIKVPESVAGMPGQRTYFSLPDEGRTLFGFRYGYYVNHVRSTGVFVTANPDSFTISITLGSDGPALVGTCVRVRTPETPCDATGATGLPAIDWRNARIDIVAKPIVLNRSLSLDVQSVAILGEFDVGLACEWPLIGRQLCAAVNRQSQRLRHRVETEVMAALNTDAVRRSIAAGVRQYIDTTLQESLLGVRRVAMLDGAVTIALALGR